MCGRFAFIATEEEFGEVMPGIAISYWPGLSYNIAPRQNILTVLNDGRRETSPTRWGLIPSWAKDPSLGDRMINARRESLSDKPSFRKPFRSQRCVILASGFYEWRRAEGSSQPFYISLRSGKLMAFAGLYDRWRADDGAMIVTSAIITTEANEAVAPVHHRMPVMMRPAGLAGWLEPGEATKEKLLPLLEPVGSDEISVVRIGTYVNNPSHQGPECSQPEK